MTIGSVFIQDVAVTVGHASVVHTVTAVVVVEAAKRERNQVGSVGFPAGADVTVVHIHAGSRIVSAI